LARGPWISHWAGLGDAGSWVFTITPTLPVDLLATTPQTGGNGGCCEAGLSDGRDLRCSGMAKPGVIPLFAGPWMALASGALCQAGTGQFLHVAWLTSEGMPHNSASGATQDSDGYLWIDSGSGGSRFDGVRFQNFRMNHGLPENNVLAMMVDDRGRVWAGTEKAVAVREGRHSRQVKARNPNSTGSDDAVCPA